MAHVSDLIDTDIDAYLRAHERKSLLRFITCGSVDDGKSTLIGRLLYESKMIFEDQLAALAADSKQVGTRGDELDFALLVDGLSAEREQGITIDVAYRYFSTDKRKFIVADTPGHEQYTRNMVTGASTADLAVILVDARKGVLTQTRRHSYLVSLLGIRRVVVAINKMDLVDYSEQIYADIEREYREFATQVGLTDVTCIPISAVHGDNVVESSARMPWYTGPTLMHHLEHVAVGDDLATQPFRLPVQWVNRPSADFRGFAGLIVSGGVQVGDAVRVLPSGRQSHVARIVGDSRDVEAATAGQSVTLTLADEVDVSRGDVLAAPDAPPAVADQFEATIIWMHDRPMLQGRSYLLKIGAQTVGATVAPLEVQRQRQHAGARRRQEARTQRHRRVRDRALAPGRVRAVHAEPRPRRVHPHRPHHEHDGWRRAAALCAASFRQRALAGARRQQERSRGAEGTEAVRRLVHGPVGRR